MYKNLILFKFLKSNSVAFVPPKPNEFDNAILIFFSLGTLGIKSKSQFSEGLSKFKVAGKIESVKAFMQYIDSTLPAAPNKCPMDDLVELIITFLELLI